jgi:hypothetical protein
MKLVVCATPAHVFGDRVVHDRHHHRDAGQRDAPDQETGHDIHARIAPDLRDRDPLPTRHHCLLVTVDALVARRS